MHIPSLETYLGRGRIEVLEFKFTHFSAIHGIDVYKRQVSNGDVFLSRSTCNTKETIEFEGETYPLVKLEISSTSHPFYTGKSLSLIHIWQRTAGCWKTS